MTRTPQIGFLPDGRRLHLQDGPIDLIVEARGSETQCARGLSTPRRGALPVCSMNSATELPALRQRGRSGALPRCGARSRAACMRRWRRLPPTISSRRWRRWPAPSRKRFSARWSEARRSIAPMSTMAATSRCIWRMASISRSAWSTGRTGRACCEPRSSRPRIPARGIATSGRHGRSFSLGIADAVTVLARTASQADAAATVIANAVDLPGHPAIVRCPAQDLQPDSDLGAAAGHPRCRRFVGPCDRDGTRSRLPPGPRTAGRGIDRRRGALPAGRDGCGRRRRHRGVRAGPGVAQPYGCGGHAWLRSTYKSLKPENGTQSHERLHSQDCHGGRGDADGDGPGRGAADPARGGDRGDRESVCRPLCRGSGAADRDRRGTRRIARGPGGGGARHRRRRGRKATARPPRSARTASSNMPPRSCIRRWARRCAGCWARARR